GGGCLHVVARERLADATAFAELMARQPVDVLKIVPSHLAALLTAESPERSLPRRLLVLGGEPLPWSLVERVRSLAPECRLFNHYGPTETTVGVLAGAVEIQRHEMGEAGGTRGSGSTCAPLGWPLGQTRGWVVDRHLRLVPAGVPGELCVGGPQVTRGYLGRPDLTAERFIPDPFGGGAGERLYRTGDLVRRRPSGPIEFLGRTDHQVKVRGFRIELGEIEAALATLPGVREALVVAREDTPGERRLVAYVAGDVSETAVDTLRASLREQLPDYMVPAAFVTLTTLPLTSNGKVDRKALPAPEPPRPAESHSAMQTPIEDALAGIWAEFLGLEQVGATDHFFDLGGHSLLAVRLMSRIEHVFGVKLPISTLFEAPTVERLAGVLLRGSVPARHSPLVRLHTGGTGRPLFLVHPIGGDVSSYVELARRLGADRPVYALQPVTVEPGAERAAPSTMEEMARQYLAAMRQVQAGGPWLIAGWSFGAILAYEMAQQIESSGDTVALLAMIDPSAPPEARNERVDDIQLLAGFAGLGRPSERQRELLREMLAEVDVEAGLDRLLEFGQAEGVLPPDVGKPWLRERFDLFSRNVQVLRGYVARPYGGRVTFFRAGASLAQGTMELTSGWSTLAHTEAHLVDSDHVSMLRRPALDHLVEQLSTDLAAVEAGAEAP
ncbi:MAG TPA: thioesterase domain-containing protein, partial [Thermoanaerobaculia bacterium]|nr:thioesterase domain-containing protein [Thermoanaerobaculia bacterium]